MHLADRRIGKRQDDVEIVDHEIENDIHVERARAKNTEPVRLKKHGTIQQITDGCDGRIETFQVPNLQNSPIVFCKIYELACFFKGCGNRFFNEYVDSSCQQLRCYLKMANRRDTHRRSVDRKLATAAIG